MKVGRGSVHAGPVTARGSVFRNAAEAVVVLCVAVGLAPAVACADWKEFIPKPFENSAFLETYTSYEQDNSRGAQAAHWNDTFVREKLTLYSNGYSYHPRFMQYDFSIAGTGREEDYRSSVLSSSGWQSATGLEYNAKLFFLPEHPYNLMLFAARYEPLFKEQSATQHNAVETSYGASFRYRKKPYFLHVSALDDSIESAESSTDVTRVGLDGTYIKQFKNGNELSFNGAFNPSWFSTSQGLSGSATEYLFGNVVNLKRIQLNSSVSENEFDQEGFASETFKNDQFAWYELMTVYLPLNLRTDAAYRYQDNSAKAQDVTGVSTQTLSDKNKELQIDAIHRLYESVDTTYTFLHSSRTSSGGETTSESHALAVNYTKSIPRGRILLGADGARADMSNSGQSDIINEPYSAIAVPGAFTLRQQNVQPGSIQVFLKSPLPPYDVIRLVENTHYQLVAVQNTFEVQVLTLPAQFVVPGTYDFLVSYSLASGNFELRTETLGGSASVQLFDDLLTPYFNYLTVKSRLLSGVFGGTPIDSTTYSAGLLVHQGPLRVRGEYQELQWDVSPYRAWRAEAQYVAPLTVTTTAYATVAYLNKYYPRGSTTSFTSAYTEESEAVSGNVQKQLFARNLLISAGGSFTRVQGLVDTNAYSGNVSLNWRIGKLDLSAGATAYASDTSGTTTLSTKRDHEMFFVKVQRRLF